jgi:Uma2 family endonuclease
MDTPVYRRRRSLQTLIRERRKIMGAALLERTKTTVEAEESPGIRLRRWTRDEYYRLAEAGIFRPDERLELINGEIIEHVSPIGSPHSNTVIKAFHRLTEAFGPDFYINIGEPVPTDDSGEPEPDLIVAAGMVDDYADHHPGPSDIRLVVEVSDSSLSYDRRTKAPLYSDAGIPEYWIINVQARRVEVYRDPSPAAGYRTVAEYSETDTVTPLFAPNASISIAAMLPRKR